MEGESQALFKEFDMIANWKMFGAGLLFVSCWGMCISGAAGQNVQRPIHAANGARQQPIYGQPGIMQQGMVQPGPVQQGANPTLGVQRGTAQPARPAAKSNEVYCIVEVGKELQIVTKPKGLNELKKRLKEEFASAKKAYNDAKKDKNNKGVKIEKPEEKTVKEVKSGLKSQEDAQKALEKLVADRTKGGKSSAR
jgi:hypothetical protein